MIRGRTLGGVRARHGKKRERDEKPHRLKQGAAEGASRVAAALPATVLRDPGFAQADPERRAEAVRSIQQTQGNAQLQRLLHGEGASLQRAMAPPQRGLPHEIRPNLMEQIEAALAADRQGALNTLVKELAAKGEIDLSYLEGGGMTYVSSRARMAPGHYGHTSLSPGKERPRPSKVVIGPDAFRTPGDLMATVMHEWQHVLQFRRPDMASEASDEFEARLWEAENLEKTGLWRDAVYMGRIRGDLEAWWKRLSTDEQTQMKERYLAALEAIKTGVERLRREQMVQQIGEGKR
jgi:hypothetical protein